MTEIISVIKKKFHFCGSELVAMKITHTSCFLQEDGTKQFSKNGINDLIEKHKTVLFHNLVIVLGGEELLYSLTQLEPSWASS